MLAFFILSLLLSNAISIRRDISILYNRISILSLLYCLIHEISSFTSLISGVGIHGGLVVITNITQIFHIFIFIVCIIILMLTSFYSIKKRYFNYSLLNNLRVYFSDFSLSLERVNKTEEQFKIVEYPLIIMFVITGALLLMSANDFITIFLCIELQSYGLYVLSTIYRNSELSTTGGLIYFLLGGLSSCFILLASAIIYANSGTTSLDAFYIISSISELDSLNL
jgi:NADH-ubiquinone oxidoreductase chain 2